MRSSKLLLAPFHRPAFGASHMKLNKQTSKAAEPLFLKRRFFLVQGAKPPERNWTEICSYGLASTELTSAQVFVNIHISKVLAEPLFIRQYYVLPFNHCEFTSIAINASTQCTGICKQSKKVLAEPSFLRHYYVLH